MTTHVVIIGAYGSAGVAVADRLATEPDIELTLIDDGDPGGGLCILRGCMPSKEILSAGAHRYQVRHDHRIDDPPPPVNLRETIDTKNEHIEDFAAHRRAAIHELADRDNVEFIHSPATFIDDHVIAVDDRDLKADYVVIATGSTVNKPDLPGINEIDYMTSSEVLDETDFPKTGIIMGFGYIGMELAPYLAEAGDMELTIIEHDDRPIDEADPVFGDELMKIYERDFDIEILTNTHERSVVPTNEGGIKLEVSRNGQPQELHADQLFAFTGRRPNLEGLALEKTTLTPTNNWVSDTMQSVTDPRTFVVGDANGKEPILHVAKEQGFTAANNILAHKNNNELKTYENIHHHVIFSVLGMYPFVRVGHSKTSAQAAGHEYIAVTRNAASDGVFKTKNASDGLATLISDANDGTVIGYEGLHYQADVMAKTMQIVIELGLSVHDLPDRAYHPTTPEILDGLFRETRDRLTKKPEFH